MKTKRKIPIELVVFGVIFLIVIVGALTVSAPQKAQSTVQDQQQAKSSLPVLGKAPELVGTQRWINSEPLAIEQLKGKVVIIDFWTYTCINCIRTLPYLNDWHAKYGDSGLVIIGVHSPEFEFEKDYNNVLDAVNKYGIKYPVVQDNDFKTWRAYGNRYWPRKYIIDKEGNIRYDHIGEGGYEETEKVIQELLKEINPNMSSVETKTTQTPDFSQIETPEIYLGYNFARSPLGNAEGFSPDNVVDYKYVDPTAQNTVYLSGKWKNEADRIISVENAKLFLRYKAKGANIVAGGNSEINIFLDGKALDLDSLGKDVSLKNKNTIILVNDYRLYNIVSTPSYEDHMLEINAQPGFELYTFTFG